MDRLDKTQEIMTTLVIEYVVADKHRCMHLMEMSNGEGGVVDVTVMVMDRLSD